MVTSSWVPTSTWGRRMILILQVRSQRCREFVPEGSSHLSSFELGFGITG